jgi:hypothetical protein
VTLPNAAVNRTLTAERGGASGDALKGEGNQTHGNQ